MFLKCRILQNVMLRLWGLDLLLSSCAAESGAYCFIARLAMARLPSPGILHRPSGPNP